MKKANLIVGAISLLIIISSTVIFAQGNKAADVKSIDAYCKTVDAVRKKRKSAELVFADTADMNDDKEKWRKFTSEKALEKFRETSETYSIAYNWRKAGKIVASNFTLFSGSGDWVKYVYHYFREDGTLAKVDIDYRTFYGDFMMLEKIYFNKSGKELSRKSEFRDLKTQKIKKVDKDYKEANSMLFSEVDHYMTTSKLPFADLFKGR